jgi:hypothetical protein
MPIGMSWGMSTFGFVAAWLGRVYKGGTAGILSALHAVSQHTGIPVVVVAAAALVIAYRVIRRGARLAYEMAIALVLVLIATKLGWIHW